MTELEWFNKPVERSRDLILKEAFKLLLQKNIEKVTVPELERVTRLHRGAIFYHFKDKTNIFNEIIDRYYFSPLNIFYPLKSDNICSMKDYIDRKNEHIRKIQYWFINEELLISPYTAFFHLAEQANLYIPNFRKKMSEFLSSDKSYWRLVACSDAHIKNKHIDPNIIGDIFRGIYIEQYHFACYSEDIDQSYFPTVLEILSEGSITIEK